MEFPTVLNWTNPLLILELLVGIFQFYSNFKKNFCLQTLEKSDQTPRFAASDLILYTVCRHVPQKDARLIWVEGLNFALSLHLHPYFELGSLDYSEGFVTRICDK